MSKPSARGRRTGGDGRFHRHNLGGGNALKAVTRTRRAAASQQIGNHVDRAARERAALAQLLRVAEEVEGKQAA